MLGVLYIAVLGPFLAIQWTYEDCGLRGYDDFHEIVNPIGATLFSYITGFGAIGSLVKFVISLNVNSAEGFTAILFVLFFLLPPCPWVSLDSMSFKRRRS